VEIPANMVAEFKMGTSNNHVVSLNGKKVNMDFGSLRLTPGMHQIEVAINSF
jgi:hypothetical protein